MVIVIMILLVVMMTDDDEVDGVVKIHGNGDDDYDSIGDCCGKDSIMIIRRE